MKYVKQVLAEIDSQLRQLQQVRHLLAHIDTPAITKGAKSAKGAKGKRHLSAAAIARIRAAQKARWAKFHAAQAKGKK